jgi:hypothetical protein
MIYTFPPRTRQGPTKSICSTCRTPIDSVGDCHVCTAGKLLFNAIRLYQKALERRT